MVNEIAERYGQGLFELATENNTVREKKAQCESLLKILKENNEVELFLRAVKITKEEKKNFITNVFGKVVDQDILNLLKLLVDRGRVTYIDEILRKFEVLANEELGIVKAVVHSARQLSQEDLNRIQEALIQKTKKTVTIENHVDPQIIAGIKVTVGNNVTDITTKTKIERMKNAILKGGQA
ncbi:MAG: F0F1 ATP synthase subunit delta [Solobacterium sp.]|jgi:ATP synthase F1, delta subunit|uniref:F0F1 ATP synthase subunit delta n=1 Tax=uncultured Solobacterium sp. TaxID=747375 RepID=UPI001CB6304C|nr:F0F1 ATP synthase subunit delta [uncultured Solobacterium sp.]MBF1114596.1 F0F1 ATP synthase subunit delta [Solobacterium sp.]MBF1122532.1 F0F1 ATP synthase subunit delta [Solobacterium sp.]